MSQDGSQSYFSQDPDSAFERELAVLEIPDALPASVQKSSPSVLVPFVSRPPPSSAIPFKRSLTEAEARAAYDKEANSASRFGELGTYMKHKRMKLQRQNELIARDVGTSAPQIFKNVSIYINGYVDPPLDELRTLILQNGGVYHAYLDKKSLVSHIIASNLTPAKTKEFKDYKVVFPAWIVDSVKAGKLLPWATYRWVPQAIGASSAGQARPPLFAAHSTPAPPVDVKGKGREVNAPIDEPGIVLPLKSHPVLRPPRPEAPRGKRPTRDIAGPLPVDPDAPLDETSKKPRYALHSENKQAKRLMEDPAWRAAHTSANPNFLESYYANSRLHWLSTWKAELKLVVAKAQADIAESPVRSQLAPGSLPLSQNQYSLRGAALPRNVNSPARKAAPRTDRQPVVLHADFDAFFLSIGLVDRPELVGKAVVVCHSQAGGVGTSSTSEIASPSYEARALGIKAGMSLGQARQICSDIISIPYEFEKYKDASLKFYTILSAYADILEAVSIDEALLEVTTRVQEIEDAREATERPDACLELAETIRDEVRAATGCEISIGVSHNIMLARLASRKAKPGGSFRLKNEDVEDFMSTLEIRSLWGVGREQEKKIQDAFGTVAVKDIAKKRLSELQAHVGPKTGQKLYDACRGIDQRRVQPSTERKSVSAEVNYGIRLKSVEEAETFVRKLAASVSGRLRKVDSLGQALTLKIMKRHPDAPIEAPKHMGHGSCEVFNRSSPISFKGGPTDDPDVLGQAAVFLLRQLAFPPEELRGVGIMITKLKPRSAVTAAAPLDLGQTRLIFKAVEKPTLDDDDDQVSSGTEARPASPLQGRSSAQGPSLQSARIPATPLIYRPSMTQVDPEDIRALPSSIRKELYPEWVDPSAEGPSSPPPVAVAAPIPPFAGPSTRPTTPRKDVSHIVRQLRPQRKVQFTPPKAPLFAPPALAADGALQAPFKGSARELEELSTLLGWDLEMVKGLPKEVLREQLEHGRTERAKLEAARSRGGLAPVQLALPLAQVFSRASASPVRPPSKNGVAHRSPAAAAPVQRPGPPEPFDSPIFHYPPAPMFARKRPPIDELRGAIDGWVGREANVGPSVDSVEMIREYLVQCVETRGGGILDDGIRVLKWWKFRCEARWARRDESAMEVGEERGVGELWWAAFDDVLESVRVAFKKRFRGGTLVLD